ncbi:MAG: DUF4468 domain-containing protein [Saprospiraceae bacterium]
MKYLFYLLLMVSATSCAPTLLKEAPITIEKDENGMAIIEKVISVPGTKDEIYKYGREYIYLNYPSGKSVMQLDDAANHTFIVKANTHTVYYSIGPNKSVPNGYFGYATKFEAQDGKFKIQVRSIVQEEGSSYIRPGAELGNDKPYQYFTGGTDLYRAAEETKRWHSTRKQVLDQLNDMPERFEKYIKKASTTKW